MAKNPNDLRYGPPHVAPVKHVEPPKPAPKPAPKAAPVAPPAKPAAAPKPAEVKPAADKQE